jgi:3-oxoadipate enol-lactonase
VKSFTIRGVSLSCEDRGSGRPLVLVHGFPFTHAMWSAQLDAFWRQYRVIAPDLRGFGQSQGQSQETTMAQFADDIVALLDALNVTEPVVFCGLSMGGYIGFQFLARHADRLRGLVLCDTRAAADPAVVAEGRVAAANRALQEGTTALVDAMLPKLLARGTQENHWHLVAELRTMMQSVSPATFAAAQRGMASRPDSTAMLAKIALPTLVLVGEEDASSPPAEMHAMAQAIPHSQYVEIPAAGHLAPLENPAAFNAALMEFLERA